MTEVVFSLCYMNRFLQARVRHVTRATKPCKGRRRSFHRRMEVITVSVRTNSCIPVPQNPHQLNSQTTAIYDQDEIEIQRTPAAIDEASVLTTYPKRPSPPIADRYMNASQSSSSPSLHITTHLKSQQNHDPSQQNSQTIHYIPSITSISTNQTIIPNRITTIPKTTSQPHPPPKEKWHHQLPQRTKYVPPPSPPSLTHTHTNTPLPTNRPPSKKPTPRAPRRKPSAKRSKIVACRRWRRRGRRRGLRNRFKGRRGRGEGSGMGGKSERGG